jgi:trehalose 6-phosphate phosphatase
MRPLFGEEGLRSLRAFAARSPLCLFDFDGTLAPLTSDPTQVMLPPTVQTRLQALQGRTEVGIVTGRSLQDIQRRLAFRPDYLVGNHGLEGVPGSLDLDAALVSVCTVWKRSLEARVTAIDDAIWLEDKGYSLSLHYRQVRDPVRAAAQLSSLLVELDPAPRVICGKFIFNLLPGDSGDKGLAVQSLMRYAGNDTAIYVGDDATDEDVFRLRALGILSARVGSTAHSAADWFIDDHHAMEPLLDLLLSWLPEPI